MMDWYDHGTGAGGWIWMMLFMLAFWGMVIFAVVLLFRGTGQRDTSRGGGTESPSALQILDERYARGEIDTEDYHARRDELRGVVHRASQ